MVSTPSNRAQQLQQIGAVIVGALVGSYIFVILGLDFKIMVLLVLLVVGLCTVVIAGTVLGSLQRLLLVALVVDVPIQLDVNPGRDVIMAFLDAITGFNISITTITLVILYALWFADIVTKKTPPPRRLTLVQTSVPLLVYITVAIFSIFFARSKLQSIFEINLLLQGFALYVYIIHATRTRQDLLFIAGFLVFALLLESMIMYGTRAIGTSVDLGILRLNMDPNGRVGGTLGSPNVAASLLSMIMLLTFSLVVTPIGHAPKAIAVCVLIISTGALILTGSRGAWLGFFAGFGLFYLLCWWRGWLSLMTPFLVMLVALPILFVLRDMILMRLFADDNNSAESRLPLMKIALHMIHDHWLFGLGVNNFAANLPLYAGAEFTGAWIRVVHNKYLLIWAELGIAGLIAYLWFLVYSLWHGWEVWKLRDRLLSPLALGLSCGIVAWMIHMCVAIFNRRPNLFGLIFASALLVAIYRIREREQAPEFMRAAL